MHQLFRLSIWFTNTARISLFLQKEKCAMFAELISRLPDEEAYIELIARFEKLLKKYAKLLDYEDAYWDLLVFYLELINKLHNNNAVNFSQNDGRIVNYITTAIKHHFIAKKKKKHTHRETTFSDFNLDYFTVLERIPSPQINDVFRELIPSGSLSQWENQVIMLIYQYRYKVSEIAQITGKSRQAVNQAKKRALKKLSKEFHYGSDLDSS